MRLFNYALKFGTIETTSFEGGLYHACIAKNWKMIREMIMLGAKDWNHALLGACQGGDLQIVKMLINKIDNGINMDTHDNRGRNRLYNACKYGHLNVAEYLVNYGDQYGVEHLYAACRSGDMRIVKFILDHGVKINLYWCLFYACKSGNIDIVKLIYGSGTICDSDIFIGLTGACRGGNVEIAKYLVERNAHVLNHPGYCLLEDACYGGNIECVVYAIECGSRNWNRGFGGACHKDRIHLFSFLCEKGATECGYCTRPIEEHLKQADSQEYYKIDRPI